MPPASARWRGHRGGHGSKDWCQRRFVASCRPGGVAHRLHFAIDVSICEVFGWSPGGQLRDQIFEASVHLGLGKSMGHTGPSRLIKTVDDDEEVFEAKPHVGDGDLRSAKSYVTILHRAHLGRLPLRSLARSESMPVFSQIRLVHWLKRHALRLISASFRTPAKSLTSRPAAFCDCRKISGRSWKGSLLPPALPLHLDRLLFWQQTELGVVDLLAEGGDAGGEELVEVDEDGGHGGFGLAQVLQVRRAGRPPGGQRVAVGVENLAQD